MTVEDEIRQIKTAIQQTQQSVARSEIELSAAEATEAQARNKLSSVFGVETPDQAREKLAQLEAELESTIASAREQLERTRSE